MFHCISEEGVRYVYTGNANVELETKTGERRKFGNEIVMTNVFDQQFAVSSDATRFKKMTEKYWEQVNGLKVRRLLSVEVQGTKAINEDPEFGVTHRDIWVGICKEFCPRLKQIPSMRLAT